MVTSLTGKAENMTIGGPPVSPSPPSTTVPPSTHSVANAAVEPPAAVDSITVAIAHGAAGWKERDRGRRYLSVLEYLFQPSPRQERTERRDGGRSDHRAPAAGQIVIGQRLQDQHFGDGIGLGATHLGGEFQPEHAGPNESIHRLGCQRCGLFTPCAGSAQGLADAVHGIQKKFSLGRTLPGKRLRHFPPPWLFVRCAGRSLARPPIACLRPVVAKGPLPSCRGRAPQSRNECAQLAL